MQDLIAAIQEKTGLPTEKAQGAAEAALDFMKQKLPAGMGDKLEDMIAGNADSISDYAGGMADQAKGTIRSLSPNDLIC